MSSGFAAGAGEGEAVVALLSIVDDAAGVEGEAAAVGLMSDEAADGCTGVALAAAAASAGEASARFGFGVTLLLGAAVVGCKEVPVPSPPRGVVGGVLYFAPRANRDFLICASNSCSSCRTRSLICWTRASSVESLTVKAIF